MFFITNSLLYRKKDAITFLASLQKSGLSAVVHCSKWNTKGKWSWETKHPAGQGRLSMLTHTFCSVVICMEKQPRGSPGWHCTCAPASQSHLMRPTYIVVTAVLNHLCRCAEVIRCRQSILSKLFIWNTENSPWLMSAQKEGASVGVLVEPPKHNTWAYLCKMQDLHDK